MGLLPTHSKFDFDHFFDRFFAPSVAQQQGDSFFSPRIDVKDKNDHYEVTAELPGVKKEDIHLSLNNGVLTLEAESKQEDKEEKEGRIIRQERRYGKITRSFSVGDNVQDGDISASFENGILTLRAPKAKPSETAERRIEIK